MIDEEYRFHNHKEMHPRHLQTADMRMSMWRAKNWDLRLLTLVTGLVIVAGMRYGSKAIYYAIRVRMRLLRK